MRRCLYRKLEQWTAKHKSKIIVLSSHDESSGKRIGIGAHQLAVIPPGIDKRPHMLTRHDARALIIEHLGINVPHDAFWFGTIANFYETKGLDVLIRAFAEQIKTMPQAQLILIGDGPERESLTRLREDLHLLDRIHFAGFLSDAPRYLPACDIFVLPSRKEGLPYTILEAAYHGIPIIATDVGGVASFIQHKKTGIIVKAGNILELGIALSDAYQHTDAYRTLAKNATTSGILERFSKERMANDTMALYRSLLQAEESH